LNDYRSRNFHLLREQQSIFHFQIPKTKKALVFHWSIACVNFFLHDGDVYGVMVVISMVVSIVVANMVTIEVARIVVSMVAVKILLAGNSVVAAIIINYYIVINYY